MTIDELLKTIENFKITPIIKYDLNHFMKWNDETKYIYKNCIETNLRNIYPLFFNEDNKIYNFPGDDREYSFLNYLNTNNFCVSIIINYLNKKIYNSAINGYLISSRQLDFTNNPNTWYTEMENAIKLINKYREEIFTFGQLFLELKSSINKTVDRGKESEEKIVKFITELYPTATNLKTGGDGDKNDMNLGIDVSFEIDNKIYTIQNKKCEYIRMLSLSYMIIGIGGIKDYDTDYITFEDNSGKIFMFKNENVERTDSKLQSTYKIPKEKLIYSK